MNGIALPLTAVLVLHAGAADMGYLSALEWLPSLLFALPAGAWVDRGGRRRVTVIMADLARFVLLGSIPVCFGLGLLSLWQLYGVAFCAGTMSVLFNVSDAALFVTLVPENRYVEGNSLVNASRALSFVGGPAWAACCPRCCRRHWRSARTRCPSSARPASSAGSGRPSRHRTRAAAAR